MLFVSHLVQKSSRDFEATTGSPILTHTYQNLWVQWRRLRSTRLLGQFGG